MTTGRPQSAKLGLKQADLSGRRDLGRLAAASRGHTSDITDNVIREVALPLGLVDVKVAAIDEDWSGLRLVWRVQNR